jgi:hypothetical protein
MVFEMNNSSKQTNNIILTTQYNLYVSGGQISFESEVNYIIFTEDLYDLVIRKSKKYNEISESKTELWIEEVNILINNSTAIKYTDSEIAKFNIMGKIYYGIPLCPELESVDNLKRLIKGKHSIKCKYTNINSFRMFIKLNSELFMFYELYGIGFIKN